MCLHEVVLESITQEEWSELWNKLRLYTWRRYRSLSSKFGLDLDDVVQQAIVDTLAGTRRWQPKKVEIFPFLCGVVKSLISHRWEELKNKVSIESTDGGFAIGDFSSGSLETITGSSIGEYLKVESIYNRVIYDELVNKMLELVGDDEVLIKLVKLWSKDPSLKPSEIAEELKISILDLRNAQKRLRRKLEHLQREVNHV